MIEIACLCDILHVKHKKLPFIAILTLFLILGKIQDGSQDGQHCWWRHRPQAAPPPMKYTTSWWEEQRLSSKSKIVSKYCNLSKTLGGSINQLPPPPPLYYDGGINLRVRPRVKKEFFCFKMKACRERAFTFSIKILWRVTYHCLRLSAIVKSDKSVCFYCIDIHGENRLHDHRWTIFVVLAGDPYALRMKIDCFSWYIKSFHRESKINYYICTTKAPSTRRRL